MTTLALLLLGVGALLLFAGIKNPANGLVASVKGVLAP